MADSFDEDHFDEEMALNSGDAPMQPSQPEEKTKHP